MQMGYLISSYSLASLVNLNEFLGSSALSCGWSIEMGLLTFFHFRTFSSDPNEHWGLHCSVLFELQR